MERTVFTEALQNPDVLQSQQEADWKQLAEDYPYAALVQLMHARKTKKLSASALQKLQLHFEHPLRLSRTLRAEIETSEQLAEQKSEEPKVTSTESETSTQKKTSRLAGMKTKPKKEEVVVQKIVETKKEEVEAPQQKEATPIKEVEVPSNGQDDVLELINELPEENPIKREEQVAAEEKKTETEVTETTEDPGDLMVMMSFTDWLHHFKAKSENEAEEKKGKDAIRSAWQKEKLAEAMDDEEDVVPDEIFEKAMKSVSFGDGLVTEPLAELYVKQGKTEKAIELYKKLSLLNPEKRTYFASRIKDLHLLK